MEQPKEEQEEIRDRRPAIAEKDGDRSSAPETGAEEAANARVPGQSSMIDRLFSAFRYRNYRFYWTGQLFSVLALNMEHVAQSWLVVVLTDSPLMLGVTGLAYAVPRVCLVLVGGAVADRTDRRKIMILTQSLLGVLYLALALLVLTEQIAFWQVVVFASLSGFLRAFDRPSRYALLPQMVPKEETANAVALGSSVWQACRLVGPAAAGVLIYLLGLGQTFLTCFASSAVAVSLWYSIRTEPIVRREEGGVLKNIMNQVFYTLLGLTCFNSLFGMSYVILLPIFARNILLVGSRGLGFLHSFSGVGALLGTLAVAYLAQAGRRGWQTLIGSATFGLLLVAFAFSPSYPVSLALIFFLGLFNQLYLTSINTMLQLRLPDDLRGRVLGLFGLTWDLMPLGGAMVGSLAEYAGAPASVAFGGLMVAGLALYAMVRMPTVRELS